MNEEQMRRDAHMRFVLVRLRELYNATHAHGFQHPDPISAMEAVAEFLRHDLSDIIERITILKGEMAE